MNRKIVVLVLAIVLVAISVAPAFAGAGGMAKGKAVGVHKNALGKVPIHPVCSNCHMPIDESLCGGSGCHPFSMD